MPLDPQEKGGVIRHFYTFRQMIGGVTCDLKSWSRFSDCLMMHTVDLNPAAPCNFFQECVWNHGYCMRRDVKSKGLRMGNGEIFRKLAGNILINIPAKTHINKLNAPADA